MIINRDNTLWNLEISDHVWQHEPWSGIYAEYIVADFIDDGFVRLKGITVPGSCGAKIENIYPSKEELIAAMNKKNTDEQQSFVEELDGETPEIRLANVVKFCLNHNTCPCEEYTEINAIEALKKFARKYGIENPLL